MSTFEEEFQKKLDYKFQDIKLLKNALTHSSFANETRNKNIKDNERLEFLGDAVLEIVTSEFLYKEYPDRTEGQLSKLRASLVCEPTLDQCAKPLELADYIYLGRGEEATGGRKRPSIISDAFEAVIGATYLDGGFEPAAAFIHKYVLTDIEHKRLYHDCKTSLQELVQGRFKSSPVYKDAGNEGPDHAKVFYVELYVEGQLVSKGQGQTKKAAEQQAALEALKLYEKEEE